MLYNSENYKKTTMSKLNNENCSEILAMLDCKRSPDDLARRLMHDV